MENQGILDLMTSKIKHITLGLHCYKIWIVYKNDLVFLFSWWLEHPPPQEFLVILGLGISFLGREHFAVSYMIFISSLPAQLHYM